MNVILENINLKTTNLIRTDSDDQGTFGVLSIGDFSCFTVEPPWRDNRSNISCIPSPGEYHVKIRFSPKYGWVYWLWDVPNRQWVLIHPGNVGGDTTKGWKTHTKGCILLGRKRGFLWNQKAVLISKPTVMEFMSITERQDFKLRIINGF